MADFDAFDRLMAKVPHATPMPGDEIDPLMPWRVAAVTDLPDYQLLVRFNDSCEGVVRMKSLVTSPDAGVFAALADPAVFAQASIVQGAVTWPGDIDLAPDAMHAAIAATGEWVLT